MKRPSGAPKSSGGRSGWVILLFAAVIVFFLNGVFLPGKTLFSNDGPLAQLMAACHRMPGRFTGLWLDLNGIGMNGGVAAPDLSSGLLLALSPIWFSKLYAILSLMLLAVSAWYFFRQSKLSPLACALGGLAMVLNSTFFSVACWGMSPHLLVIAMTFFAMGLLLDNSPRLRWLRVILAGFAVGMGVCEGADVGAIFSLYVAAFVLYQAWIAEGPRTRNITVGVSRLALVSICAAFLASAAIFSLVSTSIQGVARTRQDSQTKAERWNWATEWSLPKKETLGLVVPGLFGYRMDTPNGAQYWGTIGRNAAWDTFTENGEQGPRPKGFIRYTGTGYYEGVLLVMVALWAAIQCLRRTDSIFSLSQRKWLWFWLAISIVSLLLSFGRYAPFYKWLYALPYFSTIRNPVKFLYPFGFALVVLFGYGVDGLQRKYMPAIGANTSVRWLGVKNWWTRATRLEKLWIYGCVLVWVLALVGWIIYAQQHDKMAQYLESTQVRADRVDSILRFSVRRIGWFMIFFSFSAGFMVLLFSGAYAGKRATLGGVLLGLLLVLDLGVADHRWITYWNYEEKYVSNPVIDILRDQPYEGRVAITPVNLPANELAVKEIYQIEWLQQQFPYYNIQSFDMVETRQLQDDLYTFAKAFDRVDTNSPYFPFMRGWQLSNTRYILGPYNFGLAWNAKDYLMGNSLRAICRFDLTPKDGVTKVQTVSDLTAVSVPNGRFALFSLDCALPRARLYNQWQVNTNDDDVLKQLQDPAFDPQKTLLVDSAIQPDSAVSTNNATAGYVDFVSYAPKEIVLKAEVSTPCILLLNDHFDPHWKVLVDDHPAQLLRCNYVMRGVQLAPGMHSVEFKFQPPFGLLYVSLAADVLALAVFGVLVVSSKKTVSAPEPPPSSRPVQRPEPRQKEKSLAARNGKR